MKFASIGVSLVVVGMLATAGVLILQKNKPLPIPLQSAQPSLIPTPLPSTEPELTVIKGSAVVSRGGEQLFVTEGQHTPLRTGEMATTGADSVAIVNYGDGSTVRLGPDSSVGQQDEDIMISLKQLFGNLYVRFKKIIGVKESVRIDTPTALAAVRGTKFAIFTTKDGTSKIAVTEHQVSVTKRDIQAGLLLQTEVKVDVGKQVIAASAASGLALTTQKLTTAETAWLTLNNRIDELEDEATKSGTLDLTLVSSAAAQFLNDVRPIPSPSIVATPRPSASPISYISQMFGTGYNSGTVRTGVGDFPLSCYGAAKSSIRVITDSANESDCRNDCPVKPLAEYVSSNGGTAGMNGMYFCPPDYPACADKKNSFDTLFFNSRVHRYINSDNNVYSVLPFFVVDGSGNPRFVGRTHDWGRDTGIAAGTAGNPMLISGGNYAVDGYTLDDKQRNVKSTRGAIVQKGDNLYMCVTRNATVPDTGQVYKTLGIDNAINIDGGGSTALYVNGSYKFGPGRALPTAIIFAPR